MSVEITVLLENTKPESSDFEVEHGLSFLIKTTSSTFIFDCGHTGLAWSNAKLMNVELSEVQFVILSHSHYDHAAGFPSLLKFAAPKNLYTGSDFWREKFSYNADNQEYKYRGCGFTEADLIKWSINQIICADVLKLDDEAWLIGNFVKKYDFETIPKKFVCGDDKVTDNFNDEIVLVLRENDGAAVVTGCAHNGILNIVSTVQQRLNLSVNRVIGGIHLNGENNERINKTLAELKNLSVQKLNLGHCSGEEVHNSLHIKNFTDQKISTGSILRW